MHTDIPGIRPTPHLTLDTTGMPPAVHLRHNLATLLETGTDNQHKHHLAMVCTGITWEQRTGWAIRRLELHTCALTAGIHKGGDTSHDGGHAAGAGVGIALGDWVGPHLLQQGSLIAVVGDVGQHAGSYGIHLLQAHAVCYLQQLHMRLMPTHTSHQLGPICEL